MPLFFFESYGHHRDLHSFPTRRSSDLPSTFHSDMPAASIPLRRASSSSAAGCSRSGEHTSEIQSHSPLVCRSFFLNHTATTEIYTLSLHDALPISPRRSTRTCPRRASRCAGPRRRARRDARDRESTRLKSSPTLLSYAALFF